jgi:hypothetical protein
VRRLALLAPLALAACSDPAEYARSAVGEPLVVRGGQFFPGALPGDTGGPDIVTVDSQNNVVTAGQAGKRLAGNARAGAFSVGMRFDDLGSGYWVLPVSVPDPQSPGDLTWEAICDFGRDIPRGPHTLRFAASSEGGAWGGTSDITFAVRPAIPDGRVVVSLTWNTQADLDLRLYAPNGDAISPKSFTTAPVVDGGAEAGASDGVLDRDSNAGCVDGPRQEDVVFAGAPAAGVYSLYVDEFEACGAPSTTFDLVLYVNGVERLRRGGRLLDVDASGGVRADGEPGPVGLYVTPVQF